MPSIAQLLADRVTLAVPFGDLAVRVTYRPSALTAADLDAIQTAQEARREHAVVLRALCRVVTDWDLTDDAGRPVPLTEEALRDVPLDPLARILLAVMEDQRARPRNAPPSSAPSSPTARRATRRAGTR